MKREKYSGLTFIEVLISALLFSMMTGLIIYIFFHFFTNLD